MKYELTAKRLKEALYDKDMTAQELSNKTGIGKSSISQYVNGSHTIGNIKAYQIGMVLGVSPMWLMGLDVSKYEGMGGFFSAEKGFDMELANASNTKEALELYYKYLNADRRTRKMIDMLLDEGDEL